MTDVKKIWMHVLQNGRCTVEEIAQETSIQAPRVRNTMKHMDAAGSVRKFSVGRVSYGITRDCTIPLYVTIGDLQGAGVMLNKREG